jgi:hypothetical protein
MRTFHTGGVASRRSSTGVANVKRARSQNLQYIYEDAEQGRISLESEAGHERERARAVQALLKVAEEQVGGCCGWSSCSRRASPRAGHRHRGRGLVADIASRAEALMIHTPIKVSEDAKSISARSPPRTSSTPPPAR